MKKLKVLDLFSGIGGFSLGLERTGGFETVAFCEIDKFCQKVLKKHWPNVPIYNDVRNLEYDGAVDVITGGYPCQPFSLAGNRRGQKDDRHLWPAMFDLIEKYRPSWVIGENVFGHFDMGLDDVLSDLEGAGYKCRTFVIPACAVGAPHRRDRLWIIAHSEQRGWGDSTERNETRKRQSGTHADVSISQRNVTNDWSERRERFIRETVSRIKGFSWCENVRRASDYFRLPNIPEPLIRRAGNGISERLHALGNSVVPQIPEIIGYAILESERKFHFENEKNK